MFKFIKNIVADHDSIAKLHSKIERRKDFFPGQRKNEELQLCVRQHWILEVWLFLRFFLVAVFAVIVIFYFEAIVGSSNIIDSILGLSLIFGLLFGWLMFFVGFIKIKLTVLVATNERVVDITQASLFDQQISETSLDRIQEVTGFTHGFWRAFFGIGRLEIQTAGSDTPIQMRFVKAPQFTARKILDIQKASHQRRRLTDYGQRKTDQLASREGESFSQEELKKMRGVGASDTTRHRKPNSSV